MCKVQLSWNSVLVARLGRVRKIRSAHTLLARSDPCGMRSQSKQNTADLNESFSGYYCWQVHMMHTFHNSDPRARIPGLKQRATSVSSLIVVKLHHHLKPKQLGSRQSSSLILLSWTIPLSPGLLFNTEQIKSRYQCQSTIHTSAASGGIVETSPPSLHCTRQV